MTTTSTLVPPGSLMPPGGPAHLPSVDVPAAPPNRPWRTGFLLLPDFSLMAVSSGLEPLRMANRLSAQPLYEWQLLTVDDEPVDASAGIAWTPTMSMADAESLDVLLVCAGSSVHDLDDRPVVTLLRRLARSRMVIGAVGTGAYLLARANLLDGYRCTIHWENIAGLREMFPKVVVSSELFELDRDRFTASGGTAPMDMMLNIIHQQHGGRLAASISEAFICDRIRGRNDRQRVPLRTVLGTSQPKLEDAVTLMEANIEEPMSLDELSMHVGLSRRQLERLFQKHLRCVPTRYYLELRLARARQLLLQTNLTIVDVAFACGFVSAPHFSKCYRDHFGVPPRDERRLRRPPEKWDTRAAAKAG